MQTLTIDKNWATHHDFQRWYYEILILSNRFKVEYADLAEERAFDEVKKSASRLDKDHARNMRFGGLSFIKIDDKVILIDTWCNRKYLTTFARCGLFKTKVDLYLKMDDLEYPNSFGFKTAYWIMFPCGQKFINYFKWKNEGHKYLSMFTSGKHSLRTQHRHDWLAYFRSSSDYWSDREIRLPEDDYRTILSQCKFGTIITANNAYKNSREYEYASCGMPMVLNYKPRYDFKFLPDKHYIYVQKPADLERLKHLDLSSFAEASNSIWENYYRPEAAADYLLQLLK